MICNVPELVRLILNQILLYTLLPKSNEKTCLLKAMQIVAPFVNTKSQYLFLTGQAK